MRAPVFNYIFFLLLCVQFRCSFVNTEPFLEELYVNLNCITGEVHLGAGDFNAVVSSNPTKRVSLRHTCLIFQGQHY